MLMAIHNALEKHVPSKYKNMRMQRYLKNYRKIQYF